MLNDMKPNQLSQEAQTILNSRLSDEYRAFYHYRSAANYCKGVGYKYAAAFFESEAESELSHARDIEAYMVDWNVTPMLPVINTPVNFMSLTDTIFSSYQIEYDLYEAYEKDSVTLFDANEICAFDFLKKYRDIQNESVIEYSDLLSELELIDTEDKFQVYYFEKRVFKK